LLAVQVERDRAELARLRAANAAELANANLARLLDLPPGARFEPATELAVTELVAEDVEPLVQRALEVRPELAGLVARLAAAQAAVRTARSSALPQLGLTGSYDYANPNSRIFPLAGTWRDTWSVAGTVSVLAFDGGRTAAATAETRAQAEALRLQLVDAQRRIRLDVTSRLLEIRTAQAAVGLAAGNLEAARENVRVNKDRYQAGVSLSSELLDAETQLLRAGLDQTEATTQLLVAKASLDRAVGR
jgi:outer membrane protein TolC